MSNGRIVKGKGKFASTGVVVGQTPASRWEKKLQHQKGNSVTIGKNVPRQSEGAVGDITVREISSEGNRAYIKTNSGWVDINTMESADRTQWTDMILEGTWETDTDHGTPQYFKDTDGFVHLRGGVDSGTSFGADITTLPVGFRPSKTIYRLITRDALLGDVALQGLKILSSGEIDVVKQLDLNLTSTVSAITWDATSYAESEVSADTTIGVSLEGISFFANQTIRGSGGGDTSGGGGGGLP